MGKKLLVLVLIGSALAGAWLMLAPSTPEKTELSQETPPPQGESAEPKTNHLRAPNQKAGNSGSNKGQHRKGFGNRELPKIYYEVHFDQDPPCTKVAPVGCMIHIPEASFLMGAQSSDPQAPNYDEEAAEDEGPPHRVELGAFWIHQNEVNVVQYQACVNKGGCDASRVAMEKGYFNWGQKERKEHPMNGVSWDAAKAYCSWIGGRLPTEAEWEYAARGQDGRRFPWGSAYPNCENTRLSLPECGIDGTSARPSHLGASPLFVQDMAGSVWEWTLDWYAADTYEQSKDSKHIAPDSGTRRVIRGGGWMDIEAIDLRTTARAGLPPESRMSDLGFRCVRPIAD